MLQIIYNIYLWYGKQTFHSVIEIDCRIFYEDRIG